MGPVSQQSHLLLMRSEGRFWHGRPACAQGPYWIRVVLFLGLPCRRQPVRWARWRPLPQRLQFTSRVEQRIRPERQVRLICAACACACACTLGFVEAAGVVYPRFRQWHRGSGWQQRTAANLGRQWWLRCAALLCFSGCRGRGGQTRAMRLFGLVGSDRCSGALRVFGS